MRFGFMIDIAFVLLATILGFVGLAKKDFRAWRKRRADERGTAAEARGKKPYPRG